MILVCRRREREGELYQEREGEADSEGLGEEGDQDSGEEDGAEEDPPEELPKLRKGNRVRALNRETGQMEEWAILGLAGKRSSQHWADSYNVQDLESGDKGWINLRDYRNIERIEDEEEVLLGFENKSVVEAKEKELQNWRENNVYEEVEDMGQKAISTRWIVTEKV